MSKVLVVDDSLSVRKVVERALAGRQIEVVCAASGSEAIERLERDAPDVVVCDVVMPDRDGYEICEFIKRHPRLSHTPVLLMSGIVNDEVRERAARVQSAGILAKPFAADDLVRHLDGLMPRRSAAQAAREPAAAADPVVAVSGRRRRSPRAPPRCWRSSSPWTACSGPSSRTRGLRGRSDGQRGRGRRRGGRAQRVPRRVVRRAGPRAGRGALQGVILEYEKGMVVLYGVAASGLLAVGISEPSVLGKVRYYARRALPELARGM